MYRSAFPDFQLDRSGATSTTLCSSSWKFFVRLSVSQSVTEQRDAITFNSVNPFGQLLMLRWCYCRENPKAEKWRKYFCSKITLYHRDLIPESLPIKLQVTLFHGSLCSGLNALQFRQDLTQMLRQCFCCWFNFYSPQDMEQCQYSTQALWEANQTAVCPRI